MLNFNKLSELARVTGLLQSGFASKDTCYSDKLSNLHNYLLENCSSSYISQYLTGGLKHWSRKWEYPYILANIAQYCREKHENLSAFDNACGVNATAYLLAKTGINVTGTDLDDCPAAEGVLPSQHFASPEMLNLPGKVSFIKADSLHLPFDDNTFDLSYSISSLEHMPDPVKAVEEMIRVTKHKGLIVFTMDVAPYLTSFNGESNVNNSNFNEIQNILLDKCSLFSPPKFKIPNEPLSWEDDCKQSTGLRELLASQSRKLMGKPPSPNFYIFGGAYIKNMDI
ncbi:class I SAM-dependent methyltransferase [Synechocystis sp. PCC 7339]|uniref:class I SAM-dependent methyltransferase n=1 Tax=Synechocystis sp. PCC 7339 TaxID=2782213 RepID=UPI001CC0EFDB|nr:class I SAM-dependent methyltransferase [Synechocystis sp. PCC 7339]UAJ72564.1 class I SAM-dependent methyltransferase [Synechocystis sp. PCC 7339]